MLNFIKLLIIFSFSQGLLFQLGIPNNIYKYGIITLLLILMFVTISTPFKTKQNFGSFVFIYLFYVLVIIISSIINDSQLKDSFSYLLYSLPGFTIFIFIVNRNFNPNQFIDLNKFIFQIAIFQIFYTILKVFIWGTKETVAGTIHFSNGSMNTVFPLVSIAILIAFYLFYKKNNSYLLLSMGFLLMGWAGEKRGIYFYLIGLIIVTYLLYLKVENRFSRSYVKGFLAVIILSPILIYLAGRLTTTLNLEDTIGGGFDLKFLYQFIINYSFQWDQGGFASGRLSGLPAVFSNVINSGTTTRLFGYGLDSVIGMSDADNVQYKFGVSSFLGINGFTTALISIGFLGALITIIKYLFIAVVSFRYTKREHDPYWKSIGFGTLLITIVFFFDFFTYSRTFYHSIPLNIGLFYFFSTIIIRFQYLKEYNNQYSIR